MTSTLNRLFHQGDFEKLLDATVNHAPVKLPQDSLDVIVGALVFTGQLAHAKAIYAEKKAVLDLDQGVASRFYLAIGENRAGAYAASKQGFLENLLVLRKTRAALSHKGLFFVHQGLGFYYLYQCRYKLALSHALKAQRAAFGGGFQFGRILAGDLLGNIYARLCEYSEAKKVFRESRKIADTLENSGIAAAIDINSLVTEAMAGRGGLAVFAELENRFQSYAESNNFSKATLGLGLIRQYHMRGAIKRAAVVIEGIEDFINTHKNKRQMAQLCFLKAQHSYLKGQIEKALKELESVVDVLHWEHDHSLALQFYGLKAKLSERMGKTLPASDLASLRTHQRKSQDGLDARISSRKGLGVGEKTLPNVGQYTAGEDPIGDLLDGIHAFGANTTSVQEIIEQGYLGMLRDVFKVAPGSQIVLLDALPSTHVIFDKGEVFICESPLMQSSRLFIELLAQGPQPTSEIVRHIWGQNYKPERHNSSFYSTVSRLRSFLGPARKWLEVDGGLYSLKSGVRIRAHQPHAILAFTDAEQSVQQGAAYKIKSSLNLRQLRLLDALPEGQELTNQSVQERYKVSYATATRDLRELVERGLLARFGKGKATSYMKIAEAKVASLEFFEKS